MEISSETADIILKYFKDYDKMYQTITPQKAEMVKAVWDLLHAYDSEHEYTFNDDFTCLRKTKKLTRKMFVNDKIR